MKRYPLLKCLLLIAALLTSQLGNAFAFMSAMQGCGMDMSMHTDDASTNSSMSMTSMDTDTMDCCDIAVSLSCCDSDCHCGAVLTSVMFINTASVSTIIKDNAKPSMSYVNRTPSPYLYQPKRPPITPFS